VIKKSGVIGNTLGACGTNWELGEHHWEHEKTHLLGTWWETKVIKISQKNLSKLVEFILEKQAFLI
jgi:hypothetical protein